MLYGLPSQDTSSYPASASIPIDPRKSLLLALLASLWLLTWLALPVLAHSDHHHGDRNNPLLGPVHGKAEDLPLDQLKPWDLDPAPDCAALKTKINGRLDRWTEEPTQNQIDIDVLYYELIMDIDTAAHQVVARVNGNFKVVASSATELDLDLVDQLTVTGININGAAANYTHTNDLITITLDRTYNEGEEISASVMYQGSPPNVQNAFNWDSFAGQPLVWTLSEPYGARSWWPCEDWSDDKPETMDIRITVPEGLIVASNGKLQEVTNNSGKDTYFWHEKYPIATYLVSLAIHPYTAYSDFYHYSETDSMEIEFYIFPSHYEDTYDANMMIKDMLVFFKTVFGEYPFIEEKYGQAEFPWGGAMEHQTCTSTGAFYESIMAHELGHQWWGDMITCDSFHHIWLNEGFARYSEALWLEHAYGREGLMGKMNAIRYYGPGTTYVDDLSDWDRIFSTNLTYNRGGWIVHMLRGVLGHEAFVQFLADYRSAFEFSSATTESFIDVLNVSSGMDLTDFIHQWVYEEYYPVYGMDWENVPAGDQDELHLTLTQTQTNTVIFHMPVQIRVTVEGDVVEEFVVDHGLTASQDYIFSLSAPAVMVEIDPDDWILKKVLDPVVNPTLDQGVLLVNGVDWNTYDPEIFNAYEAKAFWGNLEIDFWDFFPEPGAGYPSTLPTPLGEGRVPSAILGQYSTVIWVGNNYNGDISGWENTSIMGYLEAGGNVLLMTRQGDEFLTGDMLSYLGISPVNGNNIYDCISVLPEMTDIARVGTQNYVMLFNTALSQDSSTLLYEAQMNVTPDRGIGVWRAPIDGGTHNPNGGQFVFLSGRPYRWDASDLSSNVETIVTGLFSGVSAVDNNELQSARLQLSLQNPMLEHSLISFELPAKAATELAIFDTEGRLVSSLINKEMAAGSHSINWDGQLDNGASIGSGVFYIRLVAGKQQQIRPILMLK